MNQIQMIKTFYKFEHLKIRKLFSISILEFRIL